MTDQELFDNERLVEAFLAAKDADTMRALLGDLLTKNQSEQCIRRLYVAYKLSLGAPYEFIQESADLSSAIIANISKQLKNPQGGYNQILSRLYPYEFGRFDDIDYKLEELKALWGAESVAGD